MPFGVDCAVEFDDADGEVGGHGLAVQFGGRAVMAFLYRDLLRDEPLLEEDGADMVIGNRMLDAEEMPPVRLKTNRFMSYIISKVSGQDVPDTQCGYRLIARRVLENIILNSSNFEIESELIVKAGRKGFKITSVQIKTIYQDEKSRINPIFDTLRFFAFMIRMNLKK